MVIAFTIPSFAQFETNRGAAAITVTIQNGTMVCVWV